MRFFTPLSPKESEQKVVLDSRICGLGSCFAQTIGHRLNYYKWPTTINPFGVVFHPLAIESLLDRAVNERFFAKEDLYQSGDLFHALAVNASFAHHSSAALIRALNDQLLILRAGLVSATHILLTFGTAYCFRLKTTGQAVGNCHKLPQALFEKELLSVEQINNSMARTLSLIRAINPKAQVILTVSPVRHLKDGMVENNRSKSQLLTAVHQVVGQWPQALYFPAYELMMDVLRDYRFYKADMIHPSEEAQDFIWEHFCNTVVDPQMQPLLQEIATIQQGLAHRPIHPERAAHQDFKVKLEERIAKLQERHPHIKF
jgi:hypothetical protein